MTLPRKILAYEIESFQRYYDVKHLKADQAFIVWFLFARFGYSAAAAINALPTRSQDNNVDAVYLDRINKCVRIVQGKYHRNSGKKLAKQNDVTQFAIIASGISGDDEQFLDFEQGASDQVKAMLKEARRLIKHQDFALHLHFITTGGCSDVVRSKGEKIARKAGASFDIFAETDISVLLQKYLDGAPFIGTIQLKIDGDFLCRNDRRTNIDSWIFSMSGDEIANMYKRFGERLFALNVRAFQGENKLVNQSMARTLKSQPEHFWFFNNGITMLCDEASAQTAGNGRNTLVVTNPQIINGQQTTVMLSKSANAARATVAMRVIRMEPTDSENIEFDELLSNIVRNTNSQTRVSPYQLVSNDRRQVAIERDFERVNYLYVRKRHGRGSEPSVNGVQRYRMRIDMQALAKAVGACELDPAIALREADTLFQDHYDRVFPRGRDCSFYLPRYWLAECVESAIKDLPDRVADRVKFARWLIVHFIWHEYLADALDGARRADYFRSSCEDKDSVVKGHFLRAIRAMLRACDTFSQRERGKSREHSDFRDFLSHRGIPQQFGTFWYNSRLNTHRKTFKVSWEKFEDTLIKSS